MLLFVCTNESLLDGGLVVDEHDGRVSPDLVLSALPACDVRQVCVDVLGDDSAILAELCPWTCASY